MEAKVDGERDAFLKNGTKTFFTNGLFYDPLALNPYFAAFRTHYSNSLNEK